MIVRWKKITQEDSGKKKIDIFKLLCTSFNRLYVTAETGA